VVELDTSRTGACVVRPPSGSSRWAPSGSRSPSRVVRDQLPGRSRYRGPARRQGRELFADTSRVRATPNSFLPGTETRACSRRRSGDGSRITLLAYQVLTDGLYPPAQREQLLRAGRVSTIARLCYPARPVAAFHALERPPSREPPVAGRVPPHDLDAEAASPRSCQARRARSVAELRGPSTSTAGDGRIYRQQSSWPETNRSTRCRSPVAARPRAAAQIGSTAYLAQVVDATPAVAHVRHTRRPSERSGGCVG
jgi:hypothetical protein